MTNPQISPEQRKRGALLGLFIGDALAMPVHWYNDRQALTRDYGEVTDYLDPKNPHPDSILWRSSYKAENPLGEILHDQAQYWGQKSIHYHQFLKAGENTLNLQLCQGLVGLLSERWFNRPIYVDFYVDYMTHPGRHRDTFIEESHRSFFANYAKGTPPEKCGVPENHIGGLPQLVPVILAYRETLGDADALRMALDHMALTHPGPEMRLAGTVFGELFLAVLGGADLEAEIRKGISKCNNALWRYPYQDWLKLDDQKAIGSSGFNQASYVDQALPAVIYLALKYAHDPEKALIANTNAGGDNAYRGSILGALLGAANGDSAWPQRWLDGLVALPAVDKFFAPPAETEPAPVLDTLLPESASAQPAAEQSRVAALSPR